MTKARFTWYPNADREILRASTARRKEIAERIVEDAQSEAPVVSGAYREGMHVEVAGDVVSVVDDDPIGFLKEYGTVDTPPHMALTDAAEKFGDYTGAGA